MFENMSLEQITALIIGAVALVGSIVYLILNQKKKVIEWLKGAVTKAEKDFGSGTGQLKLRTVYDWYIAKFPFLAAILPFSVFSAWVDEALKELKKWLDDNLKIENYVKNKE